VRVSKTGRKSFVVRYTHDGSKRRVTIGPYPAWNLADARDQAREMLHAVQRGEDPQAPPEEEPEKLTFGELADEYLERHAKPKKRSWREDDRLLRVDLLPHWESRPAVEIGRRDVSELLDGIVDRGAPIVANRVKALISKIYNFGIGRGLVDDNPSFGVPQPAKPRQRDRVLNEQEIRAVWKVLDEKGSLMAATFKLRLLTAQRGVEVLSLRWADIDGDWWTIPAEVAKNGLSHRVPLSPQAQALLAELRAAAGESEWVFPSPKRHGHPIAHVQKAAERLAELSGVDFVPHDLRRTAASHMTSIGISRLVVSKILNHVEQGVTAVYDRHSYDSEKQDAATRWGYHLDRILSAE
jgi:integrase